MPSEGDLRRRRYPAKLRFRVMAHCRIGLLEERRHSLRRPAPNKSRQRLDVVRLGGIQLGRKAPRKYGENHHFRNTRQRFGRHLPALDYGLYEGVRLRPATMQPE